MKTDTRSTSETRAASEPRAAPVTGAALSVTTAPVLSDLSTMLDAIRAQEAALATQKAQLRKAIWDDTIGKLRAQIQLLNTYGYDSSQLKKALGFASRPVRSAQSSHKGGPSTNSGWFQLFRSRALQQYVKSHPELAQTLTASQVPPSEVHAHLPTGALAAIDAACQSKANSRCPPLPVA